MEESPHSTRLRRLPLETLVREAASTFDATACWLVGYYYCNGKLSNGVPNQTEAFKWFSRAFAKDKTQGGFEVARALIEGVDGQKPNIVAGFKAFVRMATGRPWGQTTAAMDSINALAVNIVAANGTVRSTGLSIIRDGVNSVTMRQAGSPLQVTVTKPGPISNDIRSLAKDVMGFAAGRVSANPPQFTISHNRLKGCVTLTRLDPHPDCHSKPEDFWQGISRPFKADPNAPFHGVTITIGPIKPKPGPAARLRPALNGRKTLIRFRTLKP